MRTGRELPFLYAFTFDTRLRAALRFSCRQSCFERDKKWTRFEGKLTSLLRLQNVFCIVIFSCRVIMMVSAGGLTIFGIAMLVVGSSVVGYRIPPWYVTDNASQI